MKRRIITLLLIGVMAFGVLPNFAFASTFCGDGNHYYGDGFFPTCSTMKCENCYYVRSKDEVDVSEHKYLYGCSDMHCLSCDYVRSKEDVPESQHSYSNCTDLECNNCDHIRSKDVVRESDHRYFNCVDLECDNCDHVRSKDIVAESEHWYSNCADLECDNCGYVRNKEDVEIYEHSFYNCSLKCTNCDYMRSEANYFDHDFYFCSLKCENCDYVRDENHVTIFDHDSEYKYDENNHWKKCDICTEVFEAVTPHVYTDEYDPICNSCNYDRATCGTCGENAKWIFNKETGTLTISGTGDMKDYSAYRFSLPVWDGYDDEITSIVINEGITSIGSEAFSGCSNVKSVSIAESVTKIGESAFSGCSSLVSLNISKNVSTIADNAFPNNAQFTVDENNQYYSSQDGVLFNKDKTTLILYPLSKTETEYTIPSTVNTIAMKAFYKCNNLTSVNIPEGVTEIGNYAFYWMENLKSVKIPGTVTTMGVSAFGNCDSLVSVVIGEGVKTIGSDAFGGCGALKTVIIPDGVTTIGSLAFESCGELESVVFPVSLTTVGIEAFGYCYKLKTVYYKGSEEQRGSIEISTREDGKEGSDFGGNTELLESEWVYNYIMPEPTPEPSPNPNPNPNPNPAPAPEGKPVEIVDTTKVFTDVKAGKWYTNAVNYAYSHGFIAGVSNTEFGRDVPVTRGMFITILARIAGVDTSKNANKVDTKFTDVKSGKYYTAAIKWASENNIVSGLSETAFGPEASIERQQLCTMIVNFAKFMKVDLTASQAEIAFADGGNIRKYAKTAVKTCQTAGIVSGYAAGSGMEFKPKNTATRAEAAQILYKFHKDFIAK